VLPFGSAGVAVPVDALELERCALRCSVAALDGSNGFVRQPTPMPLVRSTLADVWMYACAGCAMVMRLPSPRRRDAIRT